MSYIGAEPTTAAFPFDQFSGTGAATSFTLTYAPASATSILVAISGVMQNPNLYSVIGTTLTFSPAPPTGTNNISVLYLGLPVIGSSSPGNTAFLSSTDLTATAGQTVFASAGSYTPGFVQVYRNGARLGNADFTATNGTTITLANAATAGDLVTIEYYTLTSLVNALPLTGGTVTGSTTFNSTVTINGAAVSGFTGMKNRIINGAMVIDQRNAGASVTPANGDYTLDRWRSYLSQSSKYSVQQNAGSVTPPVGFTNYLGVTSLSAYSVGASDLFSIQQFIEGFNVADLGWGTANAQAVTLSFKVYSSLTGTFGAVLQNDGQNRSYPFTYSIPTANTWTTISVTVAGDTSGTWLTNSGRGIALWIGLGVGSTYNGPAGAWAGAGYYGATGAVSVVGTNGATFYITGVQLEKGSTATSFDYRPYGTELQLAQRYFERSYNIGAATGSFTNGFIGFNTPLTATSDIPSNILFKVTKRDTPTVVVYNAVSGASGAAYRTSDGASISVTGINYVGTNGVGQLTLASGSVNNYLIHYTASSEL